MKLFLSLFLLLSSVAFADIELHALTKVPFTADLKKETKLSGPFALVAAPEWVSVNSQGILSGTPSDKDAGDAALEVEAKSGATWVSFKIVVHVKLRVLNLKVFSAPWCSNCAAKLPALEAKLLNKVGKPTDLATELYVETSDDPSDAPTASATDAWVKELGTSWAPVNDAWKWQEYRKHFPQGFTLPAAVLLDPFGKVLVKFTANTFDPENISTQVERALLYPSTNAVDIVFVADNSGSTGTWLQKHVDAIPSFVGALTGRSWRMGVVTTDPIDKPVMGFTAPFFDAAIPNPATVLASAITKLGTLGTGVEETFAPVLKALGDNPNFLRPGADLAVVIVTDEDEQGKGSTADYLTGLNQVKAARVRQYGAFIARDFAGCTSGIAQFDYAGSRFEAVIKATGGKAFNFCSADLAAEYAALGRAIAQ